MKIRMLFLGCVVLSFILSWSIGEKAIELWSKRYAEAKKGWSTQGYHSQELDELAWYGDEGEAVNKKTGFYDDMEGGELQWMENRSRVAAYYFLRPSQVYFNDWKAFADKAELIYVPSDDIISFNNELKQKGLENIFTSDESAKGFSIYWREGVPDKQKQTLRYDLISAGSKKYGGDPITGNWMWLRLSSSCIGWLGIWLGGVWLLRKFYTYKNEAKGIVSEGWLGLGVGMLCALMSLFLTGMVGVPGAWVSYILGISGWVLGWRAGILQDALTSLKKENVMRCLLWLLLLGSLFWFMASKPAGDLAALWSTAVKSRIIVTQGGIGSWMYAGGSDVGWVDMQTHYPPGFPLLGSYLTWWGGGWHERACWLLPALLFASTVGIFVQLLAQSMAEKQTRWFFVFAVIVAFSLFTGQWFWWLIKLFYAESLLMFFGLCGFGILFKNRSSLRNLDYWLAGAMLAGMGWVKNEGSVLFFLIASGIFIFVNWRQSWRLLVSAGIVIIPWVCFVLIYGLKDSFVDLSLLQGRSLEHFMAKTNEVWEWSRNMLLEPPSFYSGAWWIGLFGLFLGFCLCWNIRWRLFILWVIGCWFVIQCCIFSASTLAQPSWHLPAIPRLWLLPTLMLIIIAVSNNKNDDQKDIKNNKK